MNKNTQNQSAPPQNPDPTWSNPYASSSSPNENWGTHLMGKPAVPSSHPDNIKAALGTGNSVEQQQPPPVQYYQHDPPHPYVQHTPLDKPPKSILHMFDYWTKKAEVTANHLWHNLRTGPSMYSAALGKMNLTVKAISEGGYESLYKQIFTTYPNEKLKKTFACYLSTSTGPVAGTLYLSNIHVAFCSDRILSFTAPSGQVTWSYYKVMVPLGRIGAVNPVVMRENQSEKYIQIVTVDGHDFWFMGFVNYDKALKNLSQGISHFVVLPGVAVPSN